MAYDTRGSRPLVVDGLSFRWRWRQNWTHVSVWHVLDAGRLTVAWGDAAAGPTAFVPTPGFVARVVRRALAGGWQTHLHQRITLGPTQLAEADGFRPGSRAIALPGIDDLLDHEASSLRAPPLQGPLLAGADAVLQLVFVPSAQPASVVTLWIARESGRRRGTAHLVAAVDGERSEWLAEIDPEWLEDAIVSVRTAGALTEESGMSLEGMSVRLSLVDATGPLHATARRPEPDNPVRIATLAAWRIAMDAFSGTEGARTVLEALHGHVQPGTLPLERDDGDRVLRLFGAWSWPLGEQLIDTLEACSGPWIVDARQVTGIAGATIDAVRTHAQARPDPLFWVSDPEQASPLEALHQLETARARRTLAGRTAVQRVIAQLDPRWYAVARDTLLSRHAQRVSAGQREIVRWLGPSWQRTDPPERPRGWAFLESLEAWGWCEGLPDVGLLIGPRTAWVVGPDGAVYTPG